MAWAYHFFTEIYISIYKLFLLHSMFWLNFGCSQVCLLWSTIEKQGLQERWLLQKFVWAVPESQHHEIAEGRGPSGANIHSWKHVIKQQQACCSMRQHSKLRRKDQRQQLMQTARQAANANDQYTLFSHIRRITPKMPRKHIRLRDQHGQLLKLMEAAQSIANWLTNLYNDPHSIPSIDPSPQWLFDAQDLYCSFHEFEGTKALDPEFLPFSF